MDFLQIDPRMDEHPDIEAAGFDGARVFEAVLRACARNDGRGRLRGKFAHPGWLARRMNLTREVIGGMDPDQWVANGVERCIANGLLEFKDGDIVIPGWEKFYSPAQSGAQRSKNWRDRTRTDETSVTPRDARDDRTSRPSLPVARDATPPNTTPPNSTELPPPSVAADEKPPEPEDFEADSTGEFRPTAWGFWGWHNQQRQERELFDEPTPPAELRQWHDHAVAKVGIEGLIRSYKRYLEDPFAADRGWPFHLFKSENVWLPRANAPPPKPRRI